MKLRFEHVWALCALCALALAHAPSLGFGFLAWDDPLHITRNPAVLTPESVSVQQHLTTPELGYPIPITVASYILETAWGGLAAWHFHLINVLLHVTSGCFVFLLARRAGLRAPAAALAVLVFGLHPVVAEPVSWVTGRKDLLCAALGLSALACAWPRAKSSNARTIGAVALYGLGLLSKPAIAPLAVLIPLAQQLFGRTVMAPEDQPRAVAAAEARAASCARIPQIVKASWPYIALLGPLAALGYLGQRATGAVVDAQRGGAGFARLAWYALGHHTRLLLGLEEPTAKYVPLPWPPPFNASVDLAPLALSLMAALGLWFTRAERRRLALFGLAWSALMYLPSSNVIPLARYLADSYVYLPLIGAAWFIAALSDELALRLRALRPAFVPALALVNVCVAMPALTTSQARFHDDLALWSHARERYPRNSHVCRQWANGAAEVHGAAAGLEAADRCIAAFGDALFAKNRAVLLTRLGRYAEAHSWLARARQQRPDDRAVREAELQLSAAESPDAP